MSEMCLSFARGRLALTVAHHPECQPLKKDEFVPQRQLRLETYTNLALIVPSLKQGFQGHTVKFRSIIWQLRTTVLVQSTEEGAQKWRLGQRSECGCLPDGVMQADAEALDLRGVVVV